MPRKREQSLVLALVCFAFLGLLLSGGSRLIGAQDRAKAATERADALQRASFVSVPAPKAETGTAHQRGPVVQRCVCARLQESPAPDSLAACDSNGNVLKSRSYLHEVYQAFVLGDGFV